MFGAGTAAVVNPIASFVYHDKQYDLEFMDRQISQIMKHEIEGVKSGLLPDPHNWVLVVE
jgi:branched-chain amino acid aminotransferase